jgi:hypothetical protein
MITALFCGSDGKTLQSRCDRPCGRPGGEAVVSSHRETAAGWIGFAGNIWGDAYELVLGRFPSLVLLKRGGAWLPIRTP